MSDTFPTVISAAGLTPQSPMAIRDALLALVQADRPGYTANLPGSLIEDISSTDVFAILLSDQAKVDLVNSLTPYAANAFLLRQLGNIYGVTLGQGSTTSVNVVFTGTPGYLIPAGFTVSDTVYQYVVQTGGVVGSGGTSDPIYALAADQGSWAVPEDTVTQIITSVPDSVTLTVTNPTAGTPGTSAQTEAEYRAQVLQAGLAVSQGMPTALRTALQQMSGVQARLISVRQQSSGWQIIVGGGDPYQVAYAIFQSIFDISTLVGSTMRITDITQANPGVVTTELNHGYSDGDETTITEVLGMTAINGQTVTVTVIDEKTFSIGVDTSGYGAYVSGGVSSLNTRNQEVSIYDFPDSYLIKFVEPPQQIVDIVLLWNTVSTNLVSPAAVQQLGAPAIANYINSIAVGQPINVFEMQAVFQEAIASIIPTPQLTRMIFTVSINGISTPPLSGTGIIEGDPESYFYTTTTNIDIDQG